MYSHFRSLFSNSVVYTHSDATFNAERFKVICLKLYIFLKETRNGIWYSIFYLWYFLYFHLIYSILYILTPCLTLLLKDVCIKDACVGTIGTMYWQFWGSGLDFTKHCSFITSQTIRITIVICRVTKHLATKADLQLTSFLTLCEIDPSMQMKCPCCFGLVFIFVQY